MMCDAWHEQRNVFDERKNDWIMLSMGFSFARDSSSQSRIEEES